MLRSWIRLEIFAGIKIQCRVAELSLQSIEGTRGYIQQRYRSRVFSVFESLHFSRVKRYCYGGFPTLPRTTAGAPCYQVRSTGTFGALAGEAGAADVINADAC